MDTKVGAAAATASPAQAVTVSNINIPTGTLTFPAPAVPAQGSSSFTLNVYPFPSGYSVWAGKCAAGNPTLYGQPAVSASPGPAPSPAVNVTVRQPAITVNGATGVPGFPGTYTLPSGTHIVYTSVDAGCTEKRSQTTTAAAGVMPYPGMPYGNWKLCADQSGVYAQKNQLSNLPAGINTTVPYVGNGTCP